MLELGSHVRRRRNWLTEFFKSPLNAHFSNVFGGTEDQAAGAQGKRVGGNGNASDIFHLSEEHQQATPTKAGKKHYDGKRDNDIFGIRERVTGEVESGLCWRLSNCHIQTTNAAETQLQASTWTILSCTRICMLFQKKKQLMCDIEFVFIKKLLTIVVRALWIPLAKPFTA